VLQLPPSFPPAAVACRKRVQCGIIYCMSRPECEKIATQLSGVVQRNGQRLTIS
jgi:superfamily II DNA helicase RecQ